MPLAIAALLLTGCVFVDPARYGTEYMRRAWAAAETDGSLECARAYARTAGIASETVLCVRESSNACACDVPGDDAAIGGRTRTTAVFAMGGR